MRLSRRVHLIASGALGCSLTHERDCNAYAVRCGEQYVLIDSGVGADTHRIAAVLQSDDIAPERVAAILLTHAHLDHSGGVYALSRSGTVPVSASAEAARSVESGDEEAISLASAKQSGIYPASFTLQPCPVSNVLHGGETWHLGDAAIHALRTPGHSDDMLTFLITTPDGILCFPGDTVFHGGRVLLGDTWDTRPHALSRSLQILASRPIDALFPGHGIWSLSHGSLPIHQTLPFLQRGLLPPNLIQ